MDKISEIPVQRADAITQIRKSVELIPEIVQGNPVTSEESAVASEELFARAQLLKELVERFEFQSREIRGTDGYVWLDEIPRDILKEIGNVGMGNTATSLP